MNLLKSLNPKKLKDLEDTELLLDIAKSSRSIRDSISGISFLLWAYVLITLVAIVMNIV